LKKQSANMVQNKEALEKTIHELRAVMVQLEHEFTEKQRLKKAEEKALHALDVGIAKSKSQMEIYLSNYDQLYRTLQETTSALEKQNATNIKLKAEIEEKILAHGEVQNEIKKVQKELAQVNQLRQVAIQKCLEVDAKKHETEGVMNDLQQRIATLREVEMLAVTKEMDHQDKQFSAVRAELGVLRKKAVGSERTTKAMADMIQLNKNGKLNLGLEIKILEEEVNHSKNTIRLLLVEKEKFEHDAEVANQQYYTALEELKLQELQVQELNKKISSDQTKLKQKQSLYESVRADRNLYSKQLVESQGEIHALKMKFRTMNHNIDQMKEEISSKDHLIVKEHFLHHSVDKERELLKNELTKIRKQVQSSEVIIENQRVEIMKLQRIIEEADQESQRQKNELTAVLSERNLLTAQLVKRNAELSEMYQRIKIQRSNLRMGERNFHLFHVNIHGIKHSLHETVTGHNDTILKLAKGDQLRQRMHQLERDLLREQTKTRALMDELETPMNVHRWRILESSDPKRFDKITQINSLQKQLVSMSDKVTQTDLLVQEKEKVYLELKNVISRQPGPEVEEQILVYQQTHKDKVKQLAAMNQELEMYIEQVASFKYEIAEADKKMAKMNKAWMKRMKKTRDQTQ
jgi:chromosome segregation ATPase